MWRMKATIDLPDDLYRAVKARTAREGCTVREVAVRLFTAWMDERNDPGSSLPPVEWRKRRAPLAHLVATEPGDHSMDAVRRSITAKWDE
jgi:hypothetical protein